VRARTRTGSGDPAGAVPLAEEAAAIADSTDFVLLQAEAHQTLAEALLAAGRTDEATRSLGAAVERYEAKRASVPAATARERLTALLPPA
jgi:streptomycin 6-kinase